MARLSFPRLDIDTYFLTLIDMPEICFNYVDGLAYEHTMHNIFYPNYGYQMSPNFRFWHMPYAHVSITDITDSNMTHYDEVATMDNKQLYAEFGVNYYELLRQYHEHICVVQLNDCEKYALDLSKISS